MAVTVLSPWPTTPAALAAATEALGRSLGEDDDDVTHRLGEAAAALVERHAPGAPQAIRNEAVIRCAGWLREAPAAGVRAESMGDISTTFAPSMTGALRASGAMGLLGPWRVRRAGAIA